MMMLMIPCGAMPVATVARYGDSRMYMIQDE